MLVNCLFSIYCRNALIDSFMYSLLKLFYDVSPFAGPPAGETVPEFLIWVLFCDFYGVDVLSQGYTLVYCRKIDYSHSFFSFRSARASTWRTLSLPLQFIIRVTSRRDKPDRLKPKTLRSISVSIVWSIGQPSF